MMICIEKSGWDRRKEEGVARERGERGGEKAGNSLKLKVETILYITSTIVKLGYRTLLSRCVSRECIN